MEKMYIAKKEEEKLVEAERSGAATNRDKDTLGDHTLSVPDPEVKEQ